MFSVSSSSSTCRNFRPCDDGDGDDDDDGDGDDDDDDDDDDDPPLLHVSLLLRLLRDC